MDHKKNENSHEMLSKQSVDKEIALKNVQCNCSEIKTILQIKVKNNSDDLKITCDGIFSADSIADLVNGYCRIVSNSNTNFWNNKPSLSSAATESSNSLKRGKRYILYIVHIN